MRPRTRTPSGARSRSGTPSPAATLFLVLFAAQAGVVVLTPVVPDVAADFGASVADVGHLRVASALTGGLSALALGRLRATPPARTLLIGGLLVLAAGSAVSAAAPSLAFLAAAQAVVGVALAMLLAAGVVAAAEWVPAAGRSHALAWALAGPPAAWIVGMPAVAVAVDATGTWRMAWLAVPLLASAVALAAVALLRPAPPDGEQVHEAPAPAGERGVLAWAIGETLLFAAWGGTLVYAGALLRESYAVSLAQTGLALGAGAVAYLPGTFLARRWAETSAGRLLVASGSAAAVLTAVFGIVRPTVGFSVAIFAALAFAAAARTFAGSVYAVQASAKRRAAMTSARAAAMQFGYLLGAGVGAVALGAGGYGALGATLAGLFALTVVPHLLPSRSAASSVARPPMRSSSALRTGAVEAGK